MATLATLTVNLVADTAQFASQMAGAGNIASTLGSKLTGVGTLVTAGLTLPLVGVGAAAVSMAADFEGKMNILSLAARSSGTSLNELSNAAIKVGGDTRLVGIDATEAAEAMTNFYKAGLTTTDVFGDLNGYLSGNTELSGALRAATDLSAASELDLADASDLVAIAMATWGLSADEATSIADSFVQTADASVASVTDLRDAMVNIGPTAAAFGIDLGDLNIALGLLSERGIRGAEAGTALKSMLTNMMRDTKDVRAAWDDLGVSLYDADGQMRALPDVMADLSNAMSGMTDEQKNQYIQTLAGTYGMKAMQTLLAEGKPGWDAMASAVSDAATAQEVATARTQGFNAAMENLKGVVQTFLISTAMPFIQEFLTPAIQWLAQLVTQLQATDPNFMRMVVIIGAVIAIAGPLILILGLVFSAVGSIIGVVSAVTAALGTFVGFVGGPVLLIIAALIAVAVLLYLAWQNNWFGIRDITANVLTFIQNLISSALKFIQNWWAAHGQSVMTIVNAMWTMVKAAVLTATEFIKTIINVALTFIKGIWDRHGEELTNRARETWELIKTTIKTVAEIIGQIIDAFAAAINGDWDAFHEHLKTAADLAWNLIKDLIDQAVKNIKTVIETFSDGVKSAWTGFTDTLKSVWDAAWQAISGVISTAVGTLSGKANEIVSNIKSAFQIDWGSIGSAIVNGVASGIRSGAGAIISAAASAARSALAAAKAALGIKSPSKEFMKLGQLSMQGFALALDETGAVETAVDRLAQKATDPLRRSASDLGSPAPSRAYNLTIYTNSNQEEILQDFDLMRAWGRA